MTDERPPTPESGVWVVGIRPLPDDRPAGRRVARLLKRMLRQERLRCVFIRFPTAEELETVHEDEENGA